MLTVAKGGGKNCQKLADVICERGFKKNKGEGQRCRSVFNIGGYNSAFLPFFRDFEILGGHSGFAHFSSFNNFENLGVYSGFNENVLKQLKTRIRMHKINK